MIVPAYNASSTIDRCLTALARQTESDEPLEIIVVDDGSVDGTAQKAAMHAGVRVVPMAHRGPAAARNAGVEIAHGEIVLFTDADCAPTDGWLDSMLAAFADPRVAGAKGAYVSDQCGLVPRFVQLEYENKYVGMSRAPCIDFVDTYSAAYRRDVFCANGGFDESFPSASVEDQEFSFRLAKKGFRLVFAPKATVSHRHAESVWAYAVRKFRIGYWKVHVHRRHPGKAWRDSHTPPTLKVQVGLVLAAATAAIAAFWFPYAWGLAAAVVACFFLSAVPLVVFIAQRDCIVATVAPLMIVVRAAALASGLIVGSWVEVSRSAALKRTLDVVGALVALVLAAPLVPFVALAIRLDSRGPVFFVQTRAGKLGRPFRMVKFRTMVEGAEAMLDDVVAQSSVAPPVFKIPHDPRVTRVGRVLRRFSLDEIPQFVNVLAGDMSLVGPRPEEMRVVALYQAWHRRRLSVKPGITGPMQTDRRGALPLDERVRLELEYIEHYALWRDIWLLIKTIPAVIRGNGAY